MPVVAEIKKLKLKRSQHFCLNVSALRLKSHRLTCLAGANGSGKTTLMECLAGLIITEAGTIAIKGYDPFRQAPEAKRHIGFVPDDDGWLIPELTANEYFSLLASIYKKAGVPHDVFGECQDLSDKLLFSSRDQQLGELSHGNRKKVQIISALAHRPELIIVDELLNGLDPVVIKKAESLLLAAKSRGAAIFSASHDLFWAERLADELLIIKDGSIIFQSSVSNRGSGRLERKFMELYGLAAV